MMKNIVISIAILLLVLLCGCAEEQSGYNVDGESISVVSVTDSVRVTGLWCNEHGILYYKYTKMMTPVLKPDSHGTVGYVRCEP